MYALSEFLRMLFWLSLALIKVFAVGLACAAFVVFFMLFLQMLGGG
jgi:hypothetical protein